MKGIIVLIMVAVLESCSHSAWLVKEDVNSGIVGTNIPEAKTEDQLRSRNDAIRAQMNNCPGWVDIKAVRNMTKVIHHPDGFQDEKIHWQEIDYKCHGMKKPDPQTRLRQIMSFN